MVNGVTDLKPSPGNGVGPTPAPSTRAARQISLREHNLGLVLRTVLHSEEPLSRAQIAASTGLTRATVSMLIDQLLAARILRELDPVMGAKAGRPGTPLSAARHTVVGLGLEVNVDYIGVRALDMAGEVVSESIRALDARTQTPEENLSELAAQVTKVRAEVIENGGTIIGATFGLPGLVDSPHGPLRLAPNLKWQNVDALSLLKTFPAFDGFTTQVANEANLAAVAEAAARPEPNFIYVSGEIGVGGALVLDGEVYAGQHGWSSELGHITVDPDGERCSCGARGCLQRIVGQEELLNAAGITPGNGIPHRGIADLVTALQNGDAAAEKALKNAGRAFGIALSDVINLFDVNTVVIGGFHAPLLPWLKPHIEAEMAERVLTGAWATPQILDPKILDGAALTGAALTSLRDVQEHPAAWLEALTPPA